MFRVKGGDRAALEELYRLYQRPLLNYFHRLSWNRALAEDLLQETFLRIWRSAARYEPAAKVSTYFFQIAHNLFLNEAARRREGSLPEADREAPAGDPERDETHASVRRAIRALPEGERECVLLSEYHGFTYDEIGRILSIPAGTVKSRMFHALRRLREDLEPGG